METTNKEHALGHAPMLPLILKLALPCVAAQLINLLYNIVDRIFIGHIEGVGTEALAGVGVTTSIIILITAFSSIVSMGAAPLAAIALGKGDRDRASAILGNSVILLVAFTLITSAITYIYKEEILTRIGASAMTLPYAAEYLKVYLGGTLFVLLSVGLNTFITLQGRATTAMGIVAVGAVLNIILDYLFIFSFEMGVYGSALATVISQGVSASLTLLFLCSSRASLRLQRSDIRVNKGVIGAILTLGVSPFIMSSTEAFVGFALNGELMKYGDIHIGAMAIMQSALLIAATPMMGFSQGFMPIVGYNFGAGNITRVKSCFWIAFVIMTVLNFLLTLVVILFPGYVASFFSNDTELIEAMTEVAPTFFLGMLLFGMQRACQGQFIALGQAKVSIFIALLRKVILLIPLVFILSDAMGVMGVYCAEAIADGSAAIICLTIFLYRFPRIIRHIKR